MRHHMHKSSISACSSATNHPLWDPVGSPRLKRALFPHRAVLCSRGAEEFDLIDRFVARQFRRSFNARIHTHFNCHLTLTERKSFSSGVGILATAGIFQATEGKLFSEKYLDDPVEVLAENIFGEKIERETIAEIGNLASLDINYFKEYFYLLYIYLKEGNYRYVVVTATKSLMVYLRYFGVKYKYLTDARPHYLGPDAEKWGDYYRKNPSVLIGKIAETEIDLKCPEMN